MEIHQTPTSQISRNQLLQSQPFFFQIDIQTPLVNTKLLDRLRISTRRVSGLTYRPLQNKLLFQYLILLRVLSIKYRNLRSLLISQRLLIFLQSLNILTTHSYPKPSLIKQLPTRALTTNGQRIKRLRIQIFRQIKNH